MAEVGYVIWFYGLPAAGKSTLAFELTHRLAEKGIKVEHLDGDVTRKSLTKDLGFSPEDRFTNIERVAFVAERLIDNGIFAVCSFITPTLHMRLFLRKKFRDRIIFIKVDCPLLVCLNRDPKGLYDRAIRGEIDNFTGISAPFDHTMEKDLGLGSVYKHYIVNTDAGEILPVDIVDDILEQLKKDEII
jgi:adenylyl-sulfate kinase